MESYEKKYNKAQKWIESIYSELSHEQQMEAVAFFPELRESEDERISKEIIKYLERTVPHHHRDEVLKSKEWIAWLEKQGQKPILDFKAKDWYVSKVDGKIRNIYHSVDEVEPKFKVGDWVISTLPGIKYPHLITDIKDGYYIFGEDDDHAHIASNDDILKLWTIADAKDGDVLHSTGLYSDCIFIYNGLDNWKFDEPNGNRAVATGYCCLSVSADNMEFGIQGPDCIEVNTVKPATKIQRDLLEKAMTDAGYRWNPDENKIEKIEQKPDWNKEDEKMLYSAIEYVQTYPAHRNSVVNWLKSLKQRIGWKPSEEQIKALHDLNLTGNISYAGQGQTLIELYNDLKKITEELLWNNH